MKKVKIISFITLISVTILFCTVLLSNNKFNDESGIIFNHFTDEYISFNENYICVNSETPKLMNRESKKEYELNLSPFKNESIRYTYCDDNGIYLLVNDSGNNKIIYYDQKLNEQILFNDTSHVANNATVFSLPGMRRITSSELISENTVFKFFAAGGYLFLCYNNSIVSVNIKTGMKETIISTNEMSDSLSYYNGFIYFADKNYIFYQYDIRKKKINEIKNIRPKNFIVSSDGIFYNNLSDKNKLYFFSFKTQEAEKLIDTDIKFYDFIPEENMLYYCDENNLINILDLSNHSTSSIGIYLEEPTFKKLPNENRIFTVAHSDGTIDTKVFESEC